MATYELMGVVRKEIWVKVEADNLEEAIDAALIQNDIDYIEEYAPIERDGEILEDEYGDLVLADIAPCDYHKY